MKAIELINENTQTETNNLDLEKRLGQWFDLETIDDAEIVAGNLDIHGTVRCRYRTVLEELPIKLNTVYGSVLLHNSGLKTLKNFPDRAALIDVSANRNLVSLGSDSDIHCNTFIASDTPITDLQHCKIHCKTLILANCENLISLAGFTGRVSSTLTLGENPAFSDAKFVMNDNIAKIILRDLDFPKLKLCQAVVLDTKSKLYFHGLPHENDDVVKILEKHRGAGPKAYIHLLNELKDAGFAELAKRG